MKIDYFDLLSGESIYFEKVGHFHSPKIFELFPSSGKGYLNYKLYISLMAWNKESLLNYSEKKGIKGLNIFRKKDNLTYFDIITFIPNTMSMLKNALDFFIDEEIRWNSSTKSFDVIKKDKVVGNINRNNFEEIANLILQLNYVNLDKTHAPQKFTSDKAKELWDEAQKYLKKQAEKTEQNDEENPNYKIGNIISKLCCIHKSYNLLNVYNLTVFQLYDQFFQCSYLRGIDLNDRIFSNHGSDNYKFENWLTPVN